MTLLGGAIYAGFFGLAAVWLAMTGERDEPIEAEVQAQEPERSNSASVAAGCAGSMPC